MSISSTFSVLLCRGRHVPGGRGRDPAARGGSPSLRTPRPHRRGRRRAEALRRRRRLSGAVLPDADQRGARTQDQLLGRGRLQEAGADALGLREAGQVDLRHRRRRALALRARRPAGVQAGAQDLPAAGGARVPDRQGQARRRVRHRLRGQVPLRRRAETTCCRCRRRRPSPRSRASCSSSTRAPSTCARASSPTRRATSTTSCSRTSASTPACPRRYFTSRRPPACA